MINVDSFGSLNSLAANTEMVDIGDIKHQWS